MFENGVGDHDRGNPQPAEDLDDFVSVGAAVDAVLVLDDGNVVVVQQFRSWPPPMSGEPLISSPTTRASAGGRSVGHPHDI